MPVREEFLIREQEFRNPFFWSFVDRSVRWAWINAPFLFLNPLGHHHMASLQIFESMSFLSSLTSENGSSVTFSFPVPPTGKHTYLSLLVGWMRQSSVIRPAVDSSLRMQRMTVCVVFVGISTLWGFSALGVNTHFQVRSLGVLLIYTSTCSTSAVTISRYRTVCCSPLPTKFSTLPMSVQVKIQPSAFICKCNR